MDRPKLLIIVLFQNLKSERPYYARSPAPPLPGILLAGMTPPLVDVEVLHEMVRPVDYGTDARFVAISFMDYLAPHAYEVASRFRALGKTVVGGGKFVSTFPEEAAPHFDSILVGEAQGVWPAMVRDMVRGRLRPRYEGEEAPSLEGIPSPRYDLVERSFSVPVVTEATRGCPYRCTYCQLSIRPLPFRKRPIAEVVRDLSATGVLPWWKRKVAMILDNNLGGDMEYAKALLREVARLRFWGIGVQFSVDCLRDDEFVELLALANTRMAFVGMESLNERSLDGVRKRHNRVAEYRAAFDKLHRRGILTFAGLMFALEEDTRAYCEGLPEALDSLGVSVILPSISVPIYGTPWYGEIVRQGRLLDDDLSHYEGDHLVFRHRRMSEEEIHAQYRMVTRAFYSWPRILGRWLRFTRLQLRRVREEGLGRVFLAILVTTAVYFKLSGFQRHHARHRIFPVLQSGSPGGSPSTPRPPALASCGGRP